MYFTLKIGALHKSDYCVEGEKGSSFMTKQCLKFCKKGAFHNNSNEKGEELPFFALSHI